VEFDPIDATPAPHEHGVRMRVGVGAGVVLVMVAAGIAVVITAASAHPAAASTSTGDYSSGSSGSGAGSSGSSSSSGGAPGADSTTTTTDFVQVVGQVQRPGLYELPAGDRNVDAVAAAGGFTAKADQASLNLAQVISDGEQIVVAARGAIVAGAAPGTTSSGMVDINTADATGLETLDGIGPALAQRILAYRTAHGGFRSVNDLQNVTGIGPKKFAAIKGSVST
jgi:competence protein ComEA